MRPHSPPAARGAGWRPAAAPPGCGRSGRPPRARRAASSGACRWSPHDGCTATAGCSGTSPPAAGARAAETRAPRPPGGRAPPAAHPRARRPQDSLAGASRQAPDSPPRAGTSAGAPPTQRHRRFRRAPPTRAPPTAGPASDTPPPRHCACAPELGGGRARVAARTWGPLRSGLSRRPGTRRSAPRQPDAGGALPAHPGSGWAPGRVWGAPLRECGGEGARRAAGQLLR